MPRKSKIRFKPVELGRLFAIEEALLRRDGKGQTLNTEQNTVLSLMALEREVGNGGFDQFFVNSSVRWTTIIAGSLERVGCVEIAEIVRDAIRAVTGRPAAIGVVRAVARRASDTRSRKLDACDRRYYATAGVHGAVADFVDANRELIGVTEREIEECVRRFELPPLPPDPLRSLLDRITELARRGELGTAIRTASSHIRKHPGDQRALIARSMLHQRNGDPVAALVDAKVLLSLDPMNLGAHEHIARLQFEAGQFEESLATCTAALRITGTEPRGRQMDEDHLSFCAARAFFALGRYEDALRRMDELWPGYEMPAREKNKLLTKRGLVKACKRKIAETRR